MTASIFPVGHYTGIRRTEDGATVHTVRTGWQHRRLAEDAFGTWVLTHGLSANGRAAWSADDVCRQAEQAGIAGADKHLRALAADGLVADTDGDPERFVRSHRMGVLFVGLGNSPQEPDRFAIGLPGLGTAATLDPDSYELWQWGSIAPTLWHSCELRASVTSRDERTVSPREAVAEVLGDLRLLVAGGCAYLDAVVPD